ncbi:MAG: metal-dependent phosphohydrolase [Curvibacter sp. GWA2_64_110]|nr:MAG: metal-dependent phosphohydrolase [Curvibacter sp. GWA2_64_110]HCY16706.1 metal-dependent phosphohydrolase [Curvibacter sp.]
MISFKRKVALGIGSVSVLLAGLAIPPVWWLARENAEDSIVSMAVEESRRLLHHEPFRPEGTQALPHAQAAARALVGGLFDIAEIYSADGVLMAEDMTPAGSALEKDITPHGPPAYQFPFYESQRLPGERWVLRVFVPLRGDKQAITGYLEGVRLVPDWQREQIRAEALRVALLVALAALLCGGALYPVMIRLFADNQRKTREVLESHISMMEALGRAIGRRDSDTGAHNYRVAWISATLAEAVGLHGDRMQELIAGSFLHDVGKIGIPDAILLKPGRLDEEEMIVMRTHVGMGEDIVTGAGWLEGGRAVVAGHHEKWDGTGYPRSLAGEDIPLVARIFALADVFDALCARRPYKAPMPLEAAMQVLTEGSGKHFDPHLVKVFAGLSQHIHRTIIAASEDEARTLLEVMVRKHFGLDG